MASARKRPQSRGGFENSRPPGRITITKQQWNICIVLPIVISSICLIKWVIVIYITGVITGAGGFLFAYGFLLFSAAVLTVIEVHFAWTDKGAL